MAIETLFSNADYLVLNSNIVNTKIQFVNWSNLPNPKCSFCSNNHIHLNHRMFRLFVQIYYGSFNFLSAFHQLFFHFNTVIGVFHRIAYQCNGKNRFRAETNKRKNIEIDFRIPFSFQSLPYLVFPNLSKKSLHQNFVSSGFSRRTE